ncbi:hypothetical protein JTE90_021646 [Oedothorax gibbosus]|uniref:Carboxylesterase type B domain-containing protein n=1 Tax=Oedothorax gibbosus TaxID=931172 RepID=A0AAV6VNZ3_9ARAC|nr:hypothetical protein JTE90_021646 [Oedothorax gibbosus]
MLSKAIIVLSLFLAGSTQSIKESNLVVQTSTGVLKGKSRTLLDKNLRLFLGVPYATPPVGPLRFLPPTELETPSAVRETIDFAAACFQPRHEESVISPLLTPNKVRISEDCLYLNIYAPDTNATNLPVMMWLPGEGYDYADPQQFDGSYLAAEGNVIVITVNYRVAVFGFLGSNTKDAPGNVGLLDQRMALDWVRQNVAEFGGNPENVTLFGRFTGSMSAAIHAFSPINKQQPLFRRVILQSGVPEGDWVFDRNPLNSTHSLAKATKCDFPSLKNTIECLRGVPADQLLKEAMKLPQSFRPVMDLNLVRESFFKSVSKSAKVDILFGLNNDEGSLCTITLKAMNSPLYKKVLNQKLSAEELSQLIQENMLNVYKLNDTLLNKLANYEYSPSSGQRVRDLYIKFCGDIYIYSKMQKLADIASEKGLNTYMYELAHRPSFSIQPKFIRAGHGDDVLYAFGLPLGIKNLPKGEVRLTRRMIQAFTSFARTGNPNVQTETYWPRYTFLDKKVMYFQDSTMTVDKSSHSKAVTFWEDIIPSAQARVCPLQPMTAALHSPDVNNLQETSPEAKTLFLGTYIGLPTAEYILFGLAVISAGLFMMTIAVIVMFLKERKGGHFSRIF